MQVDDTAGAGEVTQAEAPAKAQAESEVRAEAPAEAETETDETEAGETADAVKIPASLADPVRLAEARRRYEETTMPVRRIADDLGFPRSTFARYSLDMRWSRPKGAPPRLTVAEARARRHRRLASVLEDTREVSAHLLRAVHRQIMKIEDRAKKAKAPLEERDARMLATLARTLQILMALDRDDGAKAKAPEPVDRDAIDADLVRRITRWAEGGAEPS